MPDSGTAVVSHVTCPVFVTSTLHTTSRKESDWSEPIFWAHSVGLLLNCLSLNVLFIELYNKDFGTACAFFGTEDEGAWR
jgi:hypothetical protein